MKETPRRLGVFVTYDSEGVIDNYIPYLLADICQNLEHLVIVCNGHVNKEGLTKLGRFTDDVYIRDNIGYDAGAIKDVLYNLYGWDNVYKFDELVLFNDSFFGPLYPFKEVFDDMDVRDLDYWGLIEQVDLSFDEYRQVLSHFQSYFTVVKNRLLKSLDYREFWDTMPELNTFYDAVVKYELITKSFFQERGYSSEAYIGFSSLAPYGVTTENELIFTYEMPYETVILCNNPIIKRKAFTSDNKSILKSTNAEGYAALMEHIDKRTNYDVDMIWDHILRIYDIHDLRLTMHLDCVLPSCTPNPVKHDLGATAIIVANVSNPVYRDEILKYKDRVNLETVQFYFSNEAGLLPGDVFSFDYLCYIGDLDFENGTAIPIMQSAIHTVLDNTIKSMEYIRNVINKFEDEPRLGLLSPPHPLHSHYFSSFGGEWGDDFDKAKDIASELGIRHRLSRLKRPFMSESAFWCRTKALVNVDGYDLYKGLSSAQMKVLPYIVQKAGFYSAVVMSDEYAAIHSTNCEYILSKLMELNYNGIKGKSFHSFMSTKKYSQMLEFAGEFDTVYIYGAGDIAGRCADNLLSHGVDFAGFVVTDGRRKQDALLDHKVSYLSEIEPPGENIGIILGMDKGNTEQVFAILQQKGYSNLLIVS